MTNKAPIFNPKITMTTPLLHSSPTTTSPTSSSFSSTSSECDSDDLENLPPNPPNLSLFPIKTPLKPHQSFPFKPLATLSGHTASVSCLALCGEFLISASVANDIIVWQQPDLKPFSTFGRGEGSVKSLVALGNKVFTAHQDAKIRVWKISSSKSSENVFRLVDTLPTKKDYLGKFMNQRNYVQTRRHHKKLWIEHADTISCVTSNKGFLYSGSWDKTLKVWSLKDLRCLESIKAHEDAINALAASRGGLVYSASADGKVKAWGRDFSGSEKGHCLKGILEGRKDVSVNSIAVMGDGKWVFAGFSDGFLVGWEVGKGGDEWRVVCELRGHEMAVLSVCVVGDFLCSGSADKSIGVWKREGFSGVLRKVGVVNGHQGPVKCLQALERGVGEGFLLYSGSLDRSLRVWWVPTKESQDQEQLSLEEKK